MRITKLIILLLSFAINLLVAQSSPTTRQTIQTLKVAFITKDLYLTTEEAQRFWPVYDAYIEELKKVRKDNKDDVLASEEKSLAIKKKYYVEFKKIFSSDERAKKVFIADRDFAMFIKKELQDRQRMRALRFGDVDKNNKPVTPQSDY